MAFYVREKQLALITDLPSNGVNRICFNTGKWSLLKYLCIPKFYNSLFFFF